MTLVELIRAYEEVFYKLHKKIQNDFGSNWYLMDKHQRCVIISNIVAREVKRKYGTWGDTKEDRYDLNNFVMRLAKSKEN